MQTRRAQRLIRCSSAAAWLLLTSTMLIAQGTTPSTLAPASTPAHQIFDLSIFVISITGGIFVVVGGLLAIALYRFRARKTDPAGEPAQIYGSTQIELAWTVIPILIVVVLFLATARIIFAIQDAPKPKSALDVTVIGHQFWWEFRYPKYGVVTANELHIPVSSDCYSEATFLKLTSADVNHSFWIPQLAGKTDLIANHVNTMWMDPAEAGTLSRPVRPVLRFATRDDAAARICRHPRAVRCLDQESAAAGTSGPSRRSRQEGLREDRRA
jgi:cytochrome c oxidase subunit 2